MLSPSARQLTPRTHRNKRIRSLRYAHLGVETLEHRSAPGNLGGYIGLDGISLLTDSSTLSYAPTTYAPPTTAKLSSRTADSLDDASTISPRDRELLQTITLQTQKQGAAVQGNKAAQQSGGQSASVSAPAPAPSQGLLWTENLFDPFGTQSHKETPVKSTPAVPAESQHSGGGGSQGPITPQASTSATANQAPSRSPSSSLPANPLPTLPALPAAPMIAHVSTSPSHSTAAKAATLTPAQQAAQAINQTGVDLFARLAQENPGANLALSPYSLSTALAMLYAGARGQTATQMAQVLNFLPLGSNIHADFAALLASLKAEGTSPQDQLTTANALWVQQNYPISPSFASLLKNDYGSGVNQVNFSGATEQAAQAINSWVSQQTNGMIPELISPNSLKPSTRLMLTNAVYFNAVWSEPFNPNLTNNQEFQVAAGKDVTAPMMHQTDSFGYYAGGNFTALSMSYQGDNQSMVILLPNQATGLASFDKTLTAANLTTWLSHMQTQQVNVSLPKFQAQQSLNLDNDLSGMGMPLAFGPSANFSGINGGVEPLQVSQVVQKVVVDVSEESTQAAAATAIGVTATFVVYDPLPPVVFNANHPFVYLIRDNSTGTILFMGQETNPTS